MQRLARTATPMRFRLSAALAAVVLLAAAVRAQSRLQAVPGYAEYERLARAIPAAWTSGAVNVTWHDDSRSFEYRRDGHFFRFDVATLASSEIERPAEGVPAGRPAPERGRQYASAASPDGRYTAFYRDRNLWLRDAAAERPITTDGSERARVKYGTASWVYGEELDQRTAMWWSPDSTKLAYYRFDESGVPDYYLTLEQTNIQDVLDVEAYPKAGSPNPIVDLFVYDVASGRSVRVDVRGGQAFDPAVVGYYVYRIQWSPDGRELLFDRTNRHQNVMELMAADPSTGRCRVVIREEWPASWTENHPPMFFLRDGRRFIWMSERTGWSNLYLYDLSGRLLAPLTTASTYEVDHVVALDEGHGRMFYAARDGDSHLKLQLHRVDLDGRHDVRLTDPAFHHTVGRCVAEFGAGPSNDPPRCGVSPDGRYFVETYEAHDVPASTRVAAAGDGRTVATLAAGDASGLAALGFRAPELFAFPSADGGTTLHGLIRFPPHFDRSRAYPVLMAVYAGPDSASMTATEQFAPPSAATAFGVLMVTVNTRAAPGLGKRVLDAVYLKLGQPEIDDLAAAARALAAMPFVDGTRIGIYGTSYGGYAALMALLRHPDLFAAASAASPVTAWVNYDTIYTERYMRTPQENPDGYEAGSAVAQAAKLRGWLLLYYGTADNNVHPSNTLQLVQALQTAGHSFELQVGPDRGHTAVDEQRMLEFFADRLTFDP